MYRVNASFMLARSKTRCLENKSMPIVVSPVCVMHIGAEISGDSILDKLVVNEELNLDTIGGTPFVNHPTGHCLSVRLVDPTPQIGICRNQIKSGSDGGNQQRLGYRFGNQKMDELFS